MQNIRPKWYSLALWLIPLITWILLVSIFSLRNHPPMKTLVESQNVAFLNEVESFLIKKGIVYIRQENQSIAIDASEHSRIAKQISSTNMFKNQSVIHSTKKGS